MAKRRQLEAPTPEELKEIEAGFAVETPREALGAGIPIARVAGEAAALSTHGAAVDRAAAARDRHDAARLREAEAKGLLAVDIPLPEIAADTLTRDRMALDPDEMEELKASILAHGMRMPIEVHALAEPQGAARWGLISGFRRLAAVRALHGVTGRPEFATIRALVRTPDGLPAAFVAMVEENEIRSGLSQYERGRVAVMAAGQGAFASVEAAVEALFAAGSKAKRSKVRSFALIHEELGDVLAFPQALGERAGLRLANALRAGQGPALREVLAAAGAGDAEAEWAAMEPVVAAAEGGPRNVRRGGRPRAEPLLRPEEIRLANGISIIRETDSRGHAIRFHGSAVNVDLIETVMREIERLLEPI